MILVKNTTHIKTGEGWLYFGALLLICRIAWQLEGKLSTLRPSFSV